MLLVDVEAALQADILLAGEFLIRLLCIVTRLIDYKELVLSQQAN